MCIVSNTSNCFDTVPIQFKYNNLTINGFLKDNNILSKTSKLIPCDHINNFVILDNNNIQIKRTNNLNYIITHNHDILENLNLFHSQFNYNFHHKQDILDSIDLRRTDDQYMQANEFAGNFIISSNSENSDQLLQIPAQKIKQIAHKIADKSKSFFRFIKNIIISIFFSILLIGILFILWLFRKPISQFLHQTKDFFVKLLHRHRRQFTSHVEDPSHTFPLTTFSDVPNVNNHIYPSLSNDIQPKSVKEDDDTVSLNTKNFIISYVKQVPSNK